MILQRNFDESLSMQRQLVVAMRMRVQRLLGATEHEQNRGARTAAQSLVARLTRRVGDAHHRQEELHARTHTHRVSRGEAAMRSGTLRWL